MFFKKWRSDNKEKPINENTIVTNRKPSGIKFYRLSDIVKTDRIMGEVNDGNLIFLNIGEILTYPDRKHSFLQALKTCSNDNNAFLRMVSDDTVMIAPPEMPIEINTLLPETVIIEKDQQ